MRCRVAHPMTGSRISFRGASAIRISNLWTREGTAPIIGRIRTLKSFVEDDIGFKFDLRKCRRTFGQRVINEGQSMHDVSLVMGHSTMATTQKYYCDKDEHEAARDMQRYWDTQEASE